MSGSAQPSTAERQLCVVLVQPSLPANVGAVARAMDNMGVQNLRLVDPCDHQSAEAHALATHSADILSQARTYSSLTAALADQHFVVGTTARSRERQTTLFTLPNLPRQIPQSAASVALVFGRESSGLSNSELARCNASITIPTFGESASLNLAQAVLVTLYELRAHGIPAPAASLADQPPLADVQRIDSMRDHFFELLREIRFIRSPEQASSIEQSLTDLINRSRLSDLDVRLLRGFFRRIQVSLRRAGAPYSGFPRDKSTRRVGT